MKPFFIYILRCADSSYYVGSTDELERRVAEHQHGEGSDWTRSRRPVVLMWSQEFVTRDEARFAEQQIKRWSRAKKEALIAGRLRRLRRLFAMNSCMNSPVATTPPVRFEAPKIDVGFLTNTGYWVTLG